METKYVDYGADLSAVVDNRPCVYVVNSYQDKWRAKQSYQPPELRQRSLFLTREELKERLFLTDKLVLKEEKLVLMFYQALTKEDKQQLGINSYFDGLDLANDFLAFYDQLQEYQITEIDNLAAWQQEKYQIFERIRANYKQLLAEKGYTDQTLVKDMSNFSLQFISDYDQLRLLNILDPTPLEQEMLARIESSGREATFYQQLAPEDWDEENLRLTSVTLPDNLLPEVEIYTAQGQFLELLNCLTQLEQRSEDYELLAADLEQSRYDRLLAGEQISLDNESNFKESSLYRWLETIHSLLVTSDWQQGGLRLDLAELRQASYRAVFQEYYNLTEETSRQLNQLAQRGYVYVTAQLLERQEDAEGLAALQAVINEIKQVAQVTSLEKMINWLTELELSLLTDEKFTDDIEQYLAALSELRAVSDLKLVPSWANFFDRRAGGLLNLVLRYLQFKTLTAVESEREDRVKINDLTAAGWKPGQNIMLLNIVEGAVPFGEQPGFLLTDQQRKELGLPDYQHYRLAEEHQFFQTVFNAEQVVIFTRESEEENITASSFLERLMLNYDLAAETTPIKEKDYDLVMKELFTSQPEGKTVQPGMSEIEITASAEDFKNGYLPLGYYRYRTLETCYCKFYLQFLAGLEAERVEIKKKLSVKSLGSLVHNIFERVVSDLKPEFKGGSFTIQTTVIEEVIEEELTNQRLKIPDYYAGYYHKVLFPVVKEAVVDFLAQLGNKVAGEIEEILVEWEPELTAPFLEHQQVSVLLTGRIDLALTTEEQNYIIDYKTGGGSEEQLDFYALLVNGGQEELTVNRSIYDVLDQKFTTSRTESPVEFKDKLTEELESFLASEVYELAANYQCRGCQYQVICGTVVE